MVKYFCVAIFSIFILTSFALEPDKKPVTVIIPFAAGGGVDMTFRNLQKYAATKKIELVPSYRPGAEGLLGIRELINSPKDGMHLSINTAGSLGFYAIDYPIANVEILTGLIGGNSVFVTHSKSRFKTIDDLENAIKIGKDLNIGISHAGQRIAFEKLSEIMGAKQVITMIPYKGAGQAIQDLAAGNIDVLFIPFTVAKPMVDSGHLRLLAFSQIKLEEYPNVPTLTQRHNSWKDIEMHIVYLPAGTDSETVKFWNNFFKDYLNNADVKESFEKNYSFTVPFNKSLAQEVIKQNRDRLVNYK